MPTLRVKAICANCKNERLIIARGLCSTCYFTKDIRVLYTRRKNSGPRGGEPTAEEVERVVAEQMRCLPAWWEE